MDTPSAHADCEYSFAIGQQSGPLPSRSVVRTLGARSARGTVSTRTRSLTTLSTRSNPMRWRQYSGHGRAGRQCAPSAECAHRSARSARTGRSGGRAISWYSCVGRYSLGTECPTLGYSGYSHGVSCAWTRMGDTRDGTVSGNTPVLACLRPRTPRGTRSTHTGSSEDPHGGTPDAHREYAKPPTRAV